MYRSRFNVDMNKSSLNYTSSTVNDTQIMFYDIIGSQAHVLMLYKNNIITKTDTNKILKALEELKTTTITTESNSDDIHELIESLVVSKIGLVCGGKMHTARSRNDQISFDLRLKLRDDVNTLCINILDLIEVLVLLANKNKRTIMPLYTHLQQAQIGLFSHYLLAYADSLFRDFDRLYYAYDRINESPLGAGPIGGTSIAIDRKFVVDILNFKQSIHNSIDAVSTRDFIAEYVSVISILMTNISRLSEDFIIWSTSEFAFIELDDAFTSTSSIMPHKKNCDVLEIARGKTSRVIGNMISIFTILKGLPSGYNRDLQEIKLPLWSSSEMSIQTISVIKILLENIIVKKSNMENMVLGGYLTSLDIAEELVKHKLTFRIAHKIVGKLVQAAYDLNKPLSTLTNVDLSKSIGNYEQYISISSLIKIIKSITTNSSLRNRTSYGSSGFNEQYKMIKSRLQKIEKYKLKMTKRKNKVNEATSRLSAEVNKIIKRV